MGSADDLAPRLKPGDGERAVLSALCVRDRDRWVAAAGSLLTVPDEVAEVSWDAWAKMQRTISGSHPPGLSEFDPGPELDEEPFPSIRIVRRIVAAEDWDSLVEKLAANESRAVFDFAVECAAWSPVVQIPTSHSSAAGWAVDGARRPIRGVVSDLPNRDMPATEVAWNRASDGASLGNWPEATVGVSWPAGVDAPLRGAFVIGRMERDAWIVGVRPGKGDDEGSLNIYLGWDPSRIDPLSCAVLFTSASDGLPVLRRQIRISDLPSDEGAATDAHLQTWRDLLFTVRLPRGPRRTDWGIALFGPEGALIDEWPVGSRVESVAIDIGPVGGDATRVVVGDHKPSPTASEQTAAAHAAIELEGQARAAAALRRVSTAGELESYLRWRFSCRNGELLVLDPYLFSGDVAAEVAFLAGLDRPIRALKTGKVPALAATALIAHPNIDARKLPAGVDLHDRVWVVGATGLLVGTSVGSFLPRAGGQPGKTTTVAELPHADAEAWRAQFEEWWLKT